MQTAMTHLTSKVTNLAGEPNISWIEGSTPLRGQEAKVKPAYVRRDKETTAYETGQVMTGRISGVHEYGSLLTTSQGTVPPGKRWVHTTQSVPTSNKSMSPRSSKTTSWWAAQVDESQL